MKPPEHTIKIVDAALSLSSEQRWNQLVERWNAMTDDEREACRVSAGFTVLSRDEKNALRVGWGLCLAAAEMYPGQYDPTKIWLPLDKVVWGSAYRDGAAVIYGALDSCAEVAGETGGVPFEVRVNPMSAPEEPWDVKLRPVTREQMEAIGWERADETE